MVMSILFAPELAEPTDKKNQDIRLAALGRTHYAPMTPKGLRVGWKSDIDDCHINIHVLRTDDKR